MAQLRNKCKTTIGMHGLGQAWIDEKSMWSANWAVELQGDGDCLLQILKHFSSCEGGCEFHVGLEGHRVVLKADRFNGHADVAVVREMATWCLHAMNGILKTQAPSHPNDGVRVGAIYRERVDGIPMPVTHSEPSTRPPFDAGVSMTSRLVKLAQENHDVEAALSLYGSPGSPWSKLYSVYKIIEPNLSEIGDEEEQQKILDQSTRSFLWTVQNYAGVEDLNQQTSASEVPAARFMSLTEARVYIHSLLERWLDFRNRPVEKHPVAMQ